MSETVDVQGARIAWRQRGHGPTVIVLLHGLGGSRVSWEPQMSVLGERALVAAWDLPGYGASPPLDVPMTFPALADAMTRWLDELGTDRAHVVGISFGGMVAQYVAALHPTRVASLTLLATSPKFGLDGTEPEAWRAARLAPLDQGLEPVDFAGRVLDALAGPGISPGAMAGQRAAMERISGDALRRSIDCLVTHDSRALLPSITAPTLCLVGALDDETPVGYSQAIVDLVPASRLEVVPGAGHLLNVEAPDIVNEAVLRQVEGDRR